ncbi:MAG: ribonuclease P protein component [Thermacetogeniaceae bacterium]
MLKRAHRLARFQEAYRIGRAVRGRYLAVRFIRKPLGNIRIGFAVAKVVRGKVQKNRLKRRLRSICRRHLDELQKELDIVVNIFSAASEASFEDLEKDFVRVIKRAGLTVDTLQE